MKSVSFLLFTKYLWPFEILSVFLLALILAPSATAFAQPAASPPTASAPNKSPWVATGLALGVTVGGLAVGGLADSLDPDASSPVSWFSLRSPIG
jgi:hypothetical protein